MKYQAIYQCWCFKIVHISLRSPIQCGNVRPRTKGPSLFESPSCFHCPFAAVGAFSVVLVTSLYVSRQVTQQPAEGEPALDSALAPSCALWAASSWYCPPQPWPLDTATVTLLPNQLPVPPQLTPRVWDHFSSIIQPLKCAESSGLHSFSRKNLENKCPRAWLEDSAWGLSVRAASEEIPRQVLFTCLSL